MKSRLISYYTLFVVFILLSCNNNEKSGTYPPGGSTPGSSSDVVIDSVMTGSDLGNDIEIFQTAKVLPPVGRLDVQIHSIAGYGNSEAFARMAADTLEEILNSAGFKRAVLNSTFEYHNRGMNSQQIYDTIMRAHEEDGPGGADHVLDLRLRVITQEEDGSRWINACSRSTVGIDGGGSGVAAVCPNWLRNTAEAKRYSWMAAHLIHEYMHILDFTHPNRKSASVPYKIHQIVEKLIEHPELRR